VLVSGLTCFLANVISISRHWISGIGGVMDRPIATHWTA
jgi:hypothetical protein